MPLNSSLVTGKSPIKTLFGRVYFFDVIGGLIALAVVIASLFSATRESWPWNYKDSLGFGLFLFTVATFILFRRWGYQQKTPWLLICFSMLVATVMVVLFRRMSIIWVGVSSTILLLGLFMRSKTLSQRITLQDSLPLLMLAGSIVLSLTLIEGTLRLAPGLLTEGARLKILWRGDGIAWYVPHPYIGHLHMTEGDARAGTGRPGVKSDMVDIWGFRNTWPWPEQAEIVAVGDSLTYSQMVNDDQAWTTILDEAMPRSRVLNFGLVQAGPQQYLRIYETFGVKLAPKVVLVGLFLGNDLWDAGRFDRWWKSGGKGALPEFGRKEARPGLQGWIGRMAQRSYLFTLLNDLRDSYRHGRFLRGKTIKLTNGEYLQLVPRELAGWAPYSRPGHPAFTLVLETLERIQALAKQNRTHCLVLFFPMKEEVYLPVLGEKAADLAAPFLPELDKRGIAYIDLGPYFRERAAKGEALFWEIDGHPNAQGYALIAEVVLSYLKANARRYGLKDWEGNSSRAGL